MAGIVHYTKVLAAKSALNAVGPVQGDVLANARETAAYVVFGAGTSSGQVVVESAPFAGYAGTWAIVATVNWAAADKAHLAAITGVHLALRVRISTIIGGGTVDAYVVGSR